MNKQDIQLKEIIIHILNSSIAMPVLSDTLLDTGSEFYEFLTEHVYNLFMEDDIKTCRFFDDSIYKDTIKDLTAENFIPFTQEMATDLFHIMNNNIDIPAADCIFVRFEASNHPYLGILKMNYKTSYTHKTESDAFGNTNGIMKHQALLPSKSQKLEEAAIISLEDYQIQLKEKKYEINGQKKYYFSTLFLKCGGKMSSKSTLSVVTKAIEQVQKKYFDEDEQFEAHMKTKEFIHNEFKEQGCLAVDSLVQQVFTDAPEIVEEVQEKLEKYHVMDAVISPKQEQTTKKFSTQFLTTDTGVEIKIPMDQYQDNNAVEFVTCDDGTINIIIKNVNHITSK